MIPKRIKWITKDYKGSERQTEDCFWPVNAASFDRFAFGTSEETRDGENDTDASSLASFSTNATMDNNPGPGRIIDTYIYQRLGRKVERLALRIRISTLPPAQILRSFQLKAGPWVWTYFVWDVPLRLTSLEEAVSDISNGVSHGSIIVAGLKGLVKQSQSKSIYRSATALSALIYVSIACVGGVYDAFARFYRAIADNEPIFGLGNLAESLDDLHPDKTYLSTLCTLARTCSSLYQWMENLTPSDELDFVCSSRERLLELFDAHRMISRESDSYSLVGRGCTLLADIAIFMRAWIVQRPESVPMGRAIQSISETCYFLIIFLIRAILRLHCQPSEKSPIQKLLLGSLTHFFDAVVSFYISGFSNMRTASLEYAHFAGLIRSSFYAASDTETLFPNAFRWIHDFTFSCELYPRRIRSEIRMHDPPFIQDYLRLWIVRSRRLLSSFNEIDREARDCLVSTGFAISPFTSTERRETTFTEEQWERSIEQAQRAIVHSSDLTSEFLHACRRRKDDPLWRWKEYKNYCQVRHKWGKLLCSCMDWDHDLSIDLKRLFKPEAQPIPSQREEEMDSDVPNLELPTLVPYQSLPKVIRVPFKTDTGEVGYQSYYISTRSEPPSASGNDCEE